MLTSLPEKTRKKLDRDLNHANRLLNKPIYLNWAYMPIKVWPKDVQKAYKIRESVLKTLVNHIEKHHPYLFTPYEEKKILHKIYYDSKLFIGQRTINADGKIKKRAFEWAHGIALGGRYIKTGNSKKYKQNKKYDIILNDPAFSDVSHCYRVLWHEIIHQIQDTHPVYTGKINTKSKYLNPKLREFDVHLRFCENESFMKTRSFNQEYKIALGMEKEFKALQRDSNWNDLKRQEKKIAQKLKKNPYRSDIKERKKGLFFTDILTERFNRTRKKIWKGIWKKIHKSNFPSSDYRKKGANFSMTKFQNWAEKKVYNPGSKLFKPINKGIQIDWKKIHKSNFPSSDYRKKGANFSTTQQQKWVKRILYHTGPLSSQPYPIYRGYYGSSSTSSYYRKKGANFSTAELQNYAKKHIYNPRPYKPTYSQPYQISRGFHR